VPNESKVITTKQHSLNRKGIEMSGYYPEGVTGNEYQIAGADREWDDERTVYCHNEECSEFEVEKDLMVGLESYGSKEWGTYECPTCGVQGEYEREVDYDESPYDTIEEANGEK
jgi:hypothetical protein